MIHNVLRGIGLLLTLVILTWACAIAFDRIVDLIWKLGILGNTFRKVIKTITIIGLWISWFGSLAWSIFVTYCRIKMSKDKGT